VQIDQLLDERQSDAGPFMRAPAGALDAMKPLEDTRQFRFRDARARIADAHHGKAVLLGHIDTDMAFQSKFESVRDEIEDDLLPHLVIDIDRLA
jgi:hypothetical protein